MSGETTNDYRQIADLDSRAGMPVGGALRRAADEFDRLWGELERLTEMIRHPEFAHEGEHKAVHELRMRLAAMGRTEQARRVRSSNGNHAAWPASSVVTPICNELLDEIERLTQERDEARQMAREARSELSTRRALEGDEG